MTEHTAIEQERLREAIMDALNEHLAGKPADIKEGLFRRLGVCILYNLDRRYPISSDYDRECLYQNIVEPRIRAFTTNEVEQRFLLCELLERVVQVGTGNFKRAYLRPQSVAA